MVLPNDPPLYNSNSIPSLNHQQLRPSIHPREISSTSSSVGDLTELHSERFLSCIPKPPRLSHRHSSNDRSRTLAASISPNLNPISGGGGSSGSGVREGRSLERKAVEEQDLVRSFTVVGIDDVESESEIESDHTGVVKI